MPAPMRSEKYGTLAQAAQAVRAPQSLLTRAVEGCRRGVVSLNELSQWYGQAAPDPLDALGIEPVDALDHGWADDWDSDAPLFPNDPAAS